MSKGKRSYRILREELVKQKDGEENLLIRRDIDPQGRHCSQQPLNEEIFLRKPWKLCGQHVCIE